MLNCNIFYARISETKFKKYIITETIKINKLKNIKNEKKVAYTLFKVAYTMGKIFS